jgi:hypothetical protein
LLERLSSSEAGIDKMVKDAEENKKRKAAVEAKTNCEALVHLTYQSAAEGRLKKGQFFGYRKSRRDPIQTNAGRCFAIAASASSPLSTSVIS